LIRALLPRYRYDHLMQIGWKVLLPLSFSFFWFITGVIIAFQAFPL
jgi:NADH:ubiquinone oxidoreductase subunit H